MANRLLLITCWFILSCGNFPEGTTDGDCQDGKDNDDNGLVDCADPGCHLDDHCLELAAKQEAANKKSTPKTTTPNVSSPKVPTTQTGPYTSMGKLRIQTQYSDRDMTHREAEQYCRHTVAEGKNDWRLPSKKEATEAFDAQKLPHGSGVVIWTSTTGNNDRQAVLGISSGAVHYLNVHSKGDCRALCVRDDK